MDPELINKKAFTLLELIIVIIIIGILATVGLTAYTSQIEQSRIVEAKAKIGAMRKLTQEYYLKNGTWTGILSSDVGAVTTCSSDGYFSYGINDLGTYIALQSFRCTAGGKAPDTTRKYYFRLYYWPNTGAGRWACYYYDDSSACFGYPSS